MSDEISKKDLLACAAQIISGYASNNPVADLDALIRSVYRTLHDISFSAAGPANKSEPAVAIDQSVTDDYIVCLEDGKKLKMLKRYLKSAYDMTPEEYREKWGLAPDYPMVAPNYAEKRSRLAKKSGLGKGRRGS